MTICLLLLVILTSVPDEPFHRYRASRSRDRGIYVIQERRVTDFEGPKLVKGSSGFSRPFSWFFLCGYNIGNV